MTSHETPNWRTTRCSAVVVPFPGVDPIVAPWRRLYDPSGRAGLVAHVTLLVPFVPAGEITDHAIDALRETLTGFTPFDVEFRRCDRFPGTLFLAPEPDLAFRQMTRALVAHWPQHLPYGGEHPEPTPHLTLADGQTEGAMDRIHAEFGAHLPIRGRADSVSLFVGSNEEGWGERVRMHLGDGSLAGHA